MVKAGLRILVLLSAVSGSAALLPACTLADPAARPLAFSADQTPDMAIQPIANTAGNSAVSPVGSWMAENIRGAGVAGDRQSILEIAAGGAVSGTGGCNRIRGTVEVSGETIAFSALATTRMACDKGLMDQESRFLAALAEARTWRVDPATRKLMLLGEDGTAVLVLARM